MSTEAITEAMTKALEALRTAVMLVDTCEWHPSWRERLTPAITLLESALASPGPERGETVEGLMEIARCYAHAYHNRDEHMEAKFKANLRDIATRLAATPQEAAPAPRLTDAQVWQIAKDHGLHWHMHGDMVLRDNADPHQSAFGSRMLNFAAAIESTVASPAPAVRMLTREEEASLCLGLPRRVYVFIQRKFCEVNGLRVGAALEAPQSCNKVPPGNGYCVKCAQGLYEQCLYVHPAAPQTDGAARSTVDTPGAGTSASLSIPDGWKLVPVKPTNDMLSAGVKALMAFWDRHAYHDPAGCYGAMLNSSPEAHQPRIAPAIPASNERGEK